MMFSKAFSAFEGVLAEDADESLKIPACTDSGCPQPASQRDSTQAPLPRSCLDYLRKGEEGCGVYRIFDNTGQSFPVYCDMNSEPGNAWTLIQSWSLNHRSLDVFKKIPLKYNSPVNETAPNWDLYRQTLPRMEALKGHSTHWRATCSYPTHGVDYTDYVRGSFKDFDILEYIGAGQCKKVELINIRGHIGIQQTVKFWQGDSWSLHTDSTYAGCQFYPKAGSVRQEDNFGHYAYVNSKFRCTAAPRATTQWWFGGHV